MKAFLTETLSQLNNNADPKELESSQTPLPTNQENSEILEPQEVQSSEQKVQKSVKWSDQNHEAIFDKNEPSNTLIIPEKLQAIEEVKLHLRSSNDVSKSKRSEDESAGVNLEGHKVIHLTTANPFAKKTQSTTLAGNATSQNQLPKLAAGSVDPLKYWRKSVN